STRATRPADAKDAGRVPRASADRSALAEAGVEGLAQALAEEIEGENDDENRRARDQREPRRVEDEALAVREDVAPGRARGRHAEAEERQARLDQDRAGDAERGRDQDRADRVGQEVAPDHAAPRRTRG